MKLSCDRHKIFCIVSYSTILATLSLIFLLVYWAIYPYEILTFGNENGIILTPSVPSGGYLQMQQDYCKKIDYTSIIDRQFIDSVIYQIPQSLNKRPLGCHKRIEQIYIPKAIPPGIYYISTNISFRVNPIRMVTLNVKTATFEITNGR